MSQRIGVLIAEDHALVREGLRTLLERVPGVAVVGEAANGREAIEAAGRVHPDLVLMDVSMPDLNGLDAARRITGLFPRVRILMLSMHRDVAYFREALAAGASGYVLKTADAAQLAAAIRSVMRGVPYWDSGVSASGAPAPVRTGATQPPPDTRLTPRQREVLQLIAEGRWTKEIAHILGRSVKTVETHRTQLMKRLDVHDVVGLVRQAIRQGMTQIE